MPNDGESILDGSSTLDTMVDPVVIQEPILSVQGDVKDTIADTMARVKLKSEIEKKDIAELENAIETNEFGLIRKKMKEEIGKLADEYTNKDGGATGYLPPECYTRYVIVRLSKLTPKKFLKLLYWGAGNQESLSAFLDTDFSYGINENLKLLPQEILKKSPDFKKPRKKAEIIGELRTMISKREINKNAKLQRFIIDNFGSSFHGKD